MKVKVTDERNVHVSFYNSSLLMRSVTKIYTGSKMPQKYAVKWQSAGTVPSREKVKLVHRYPGEENRTSRMAMVSYILRNKMARHIVLDQAYFGNPLTAQK